MCSVRDICPYPIRDTHQSRRLSSEADSDCRPHGPEPCVLPTAPPLEVVFKFTSPESCRVLPRGLEPPISSSGGMRVFHLHHGSTQYPPRESNPDLRFRKPPSCPLDEEDIVPLQGLEPRISSSVARRVNPLRYRGILVADHIECSGTRTELLLP